MRRTMSLTENQTGPVSWIALAMLGLLLTLSGSPAPQAATAADAVEEAADEEEGAPAPESGRAPSADPSTADRGTEEPQLIERVRVIGGPVEKIPGSVDYLDQEILERQSYGDIHRVLSHVPGVNIQEEDGYGLRPNIGMRGSGTERSQKITLMEDGVLAAPAPYAAPSAYYFPTVGRMAGVEVRKGSSSIQHGPFTNGGVLNLLSSSIPSTFTGNLEMALGEDQTHRGRGRIGDSSDRFGWMVETYQMDSVGFKQLDSGGSTGFDLEDYLAKLRFTSSPDARMFQAVELKLGKTEQFAHETYLGLTQGDFERTPFRRYAASQQDTLDTDHEQIQLRYMARPSRTVDMTATLYRNEFQRNWRKLGKVGRWSDIDQKFEGADIADILGAPQSYADELDILRGDADSLADALNVRNNRRNYFSEGLHVVVGVNPHGKARNHDIEIGVRFHRDEEDRFQEEDLYRMTAGEMTLTRAGDPGSQANRINRAEAWAFFVRDTISIDRWTINPGVRLELIDFTRLDYGKNDPLRTGVALGRRENDVNELIPGIGVNYQLNQTSGLFAGVHRGFAPPGAGANQETESEESINYEFGYRIRRSSLDVQLVGYFNDYDNLLGTDTLSGGGEGTGDLFNGGAVHVRGIEAGVGYDPASRRGLRFSTPLNLTYTYTEAIFQNDFETDFSGWGDEVQAGDELPYVPRHQTSLEAGWVDSKWSAFVNLIYVGEARTQAGQGPVPLDQRSDAHLLVDLTANHFVRPGLKLFVQVRNLTDEIYVAARRPAGARPGMPRTALAGISWDF